MGCFSDLPGELQNVIYALLVERANAFAPTQEERLHGCETSNLAGVSRQLRADSLAIFFSNNLSISRHWTGLTGGYRKLD
jgi:hypothetical protein